MTAVTTSTAASSEPVADLVAVCRYDAISPERGVAARVHGDQVAVIRTFDGALYAVSQRDPYSGAMILSRGIVGSRGGRPTVASPMYKQVFDLVSGECLETMGEPARPISTYPTLVADGVVFVGPARCAADPAGDSS